MPRPPPPTLMKEGKGGKERKKGGKVKMEGKKWREKGRRTKGINTSFLSKNVDRKLIVD